MDSGLLTLLKEERHVLNLVALRLSVTTCYLFRNGERWVLVDTGYAEDWELFKRRLGDANVDMNSISHLVLTHHHDDHVGLIHELVAKNSRIVVTMCEATCELLTAGRNDMSHGGGLINKRIAWLIGLKQLYVWLKTGKRQRKADNLCFTSYIARPTDQVFSSEVSLQSLGIQAEGRIVVTPGHTVDSISILFTDGDCLVGDAAAKMLTFAGTHNCVIFVTDLDQYYKSWKKLLAAGAKRIFPAHGGSFTAKQLLRNLGKNKAKDMVKTA